MNEPKGQILPDSAFGKALTELTARSETIAEIGAWHGQGSTKCLALGLIRPEQRMWSVEPDGDCFREASEFWRDEPRITFINRHALDALDLLPARIDLLLLDGDDLTSFTEFFLLHTRCRWIALDDTREFKNRLSRQCALAVKWKVLHDDLDDRNGWAVFERESAQHT